MAVVATADVVRRNPFNVVPSACPQGVLTAPRQECRQARKPVKRRNAFFLFVTRNRLISNPGLKVCATSPIVRG